MLCKILDYKTEKNYNVSFSCLALVAWFYWSSVQNASIINDENSNFMWTVFKLLDQNYVTLFFDSSWNHDVLEEVTYKCLVKACVVGMYVNIYWFLIKQQNDMQFVYLCFSILFVPIRFLLLFTETFFSDRTNCRKQLTRIKVFECWLNQCLWILNGWCCLAVKYVVLFNVFLKI